MEICKCSLLADKDKLNLRVIFIDGQEIFVQ